MQRRALLATLGATASATALGGCLGDATGRDDTTTDGTTTDGTTTTPANRTRFVVEDVTLDDLPDDVDADVTVTGATDATEFYPPTVQVAVTNTADAARTWQFGAIVPWSTLYGERGDGDATALLAPGGVGNDVVPNAPQDDACWRATDGIATVQVVNDVEFAPGETRRGTYALLGGPESDCLTAATYRFESSNYLGETEWGFEVSLADAE
ncbi:hypothetical protein [Salarchaeum japonicum]|uniref:Uncharacterized protein n=1 Tax=Salarchaeum japonicum TaxID=555573 RepID=A0AAV3T2C9_9EURY|nr:hypothetical protein [Salarchaeum japonicum]